jgi:hypothetical protein
VEGVEKTMVIRFALLAAGLLSAAEIHGQTVRLTVHEWGAFTSIVDRDGAPQRWLPLTGTSDLPCFVHRFEGLVKGALEGTVRMETPVLYFYSPEPVHASVHVNFRGGTFTEWYPRAKLEPRFNNPAAIEWNPIKVSPEEHVLPFEPGRSHYYAARQTDALSIESGGEYDKMLFYRGVGNFPIPLRAVLGEDGQLQISNTASTSLPLVVVFENRGGKIGYRLLYSLAVSNIVGIEQMTGSLAELRKDLEAGLVESGLYPREAAAMLETWRDSWFEEGVRVFYILPQSSVDEVLPLSIAPQPVQIVRAFVGRVEVLASWMQAEIVPALRDGDLEVLAKYGRFLPAFIHQIGATPQHASTLKWLEAQNDLANRPAAKPCSQ